MREEICDVIDIHCLVELVIVLVIKVSNDLIMESTMLKYPSDVVFKIILKWSCHVMLCLSDHVIKFISNTLKISMANLFHSFHVKECKKKYI